MNRLAFLAIVLVVTGCASGPFRPRTAPPSAPPDTLETLKSRVVELGRQAAVHEVEIARLRQAVAALEARLGTGAARATPPALTAPTVRGTLDDTGPVVRSAPLDVEDLPAPDPTPPPAAVPIPPMPASGRATAEVQALYDQAYGAYLERRYVDAEALFGRFLVAHGDTDLGDNAQYWIGESRFARGDHAGALDAFRATIDRYPEGNKLGDALLKSADCLAALGDLPAARMAYQEVIRRFPGTPAAAAAEERRSRLP